MNVSACIEWLFADRGRPFPDRIFAAAAYGFTHIEFWTAHDKDIPQVERALAETGVTVTAFVSEPVGRLVDASTHDAFIDGVEASTELASRLRAGGLIVVAGDALPGVPRSDQHGALVEALRRAASIAASARVQLLLEPLNTRVDHPGYFLDSTLEGIDVVREVGHQSVRLLYDLYHSIVMGEEPQEVLTGAGDLIGHVHVADLPGRHEPGSGRIDWPRQVGAVRAAGYAGPLGLEYMPLASTESGLATVRSVLGEPA